MDMVVYVMCCISTLILISLVIFGLALYHTDRLNCESVWLNNTDTNFLCGIRLN